MAGQNVEIGNVDRTVRLCCRDYLLSDGGNQPPPDLRIRLTETEKRQAAASGDGMAECVTVLRRLAEAFLSRDILLLHGAAVAADGAAYLFTAPSGTGKSTRARLWMAEYPGSFVLNGDKPFLLFRENRILACGSPWSGKEGWNRNDMLPLKAVFLLERADRDRVTELSLAQAFPKLLRQTWRPEDPALGRKTISLLRGMEGRLRFFRFESTMTGASVRLARQTADLGAKLNPEN